MKIFVKCETCKVEIPRDKCAFATHKKVIDGKEYVYCCSIAQRKHTFNRTVMDPEGQKGSR